MLSLAELIVETDETKEVANLQKPAFRALGPPKHRKQVSCLDRASVYSISKNNIARQ